MSGAVNVVFRVANVLTLGLSGKLLDALTPSPKDQVQTLGDISRQTAKEGDPRVIVWGRVRPIGGNIIHCQAPVKRWVVTSTSSGGKGGSKKKQEQRTEHVYRTYAIGVCEGPITAFSRIWRNNKLVYDARGNAWGAANNPIFLRTFRLYLGGWGQMPDPTLQSIWGSGNVPAYRGTAYMVSIDEDLTDLGGSVPQFLFEVERAEGTYLTSRLYSGEDSERADAQLLSVGTPPQVPPESIQMTPTAIVDGTLRTPIINYTVLPEALDFAQTSVVDGYLRLPVVSYAVPYEPANMSSPSIISGSLRSVIINYNIPQESLNTSLNGIIQGSLQ